MSSDDQKLMIRSARQQIAYTPEMIEELRKCKNDPDYFITNYVYLKHPTRGAMLFRPFEYQKRLIRAYVENRNLVVMLSRQAGKSQLAAAFLLWWSIFKDNQYVLIASNLQFGADDIMSRLWFAYEELPMWMKPGVTKNDQRTKKFDNGTTIAAVATTKKSGRGRSASILYLDELAFVDASIADEFWTSILPTLDTGGKCIITSTPDHDENLFAKIWFNATPLEYSYHWPYDKNKEDILAQNDYETIFETEGAKLMYENEIDSYLASDDDEESEIGFKRFYAPWTTVPLTIAKDGTPIRYRDDKFKIQKLTKGNVTPEKFATEYECRFMSSGNTLVTGSAISKLNTTIRKPVFVDKWGGRWFREFNEEDTNLIVAMDPSGDGVGDASVIQVLALPSMEQVAEWSSHTADQAEQARMLYRMLYRIDYMLENLGTREYVNIYYSVERNGLGVGVIRALENSDLDDIDAIRIDSTIRSTSKHGERGYDRPTLNVHAGIITTNASKIRYALDLKQQIESGLITIRSDRLVSELKSFVRVGNTFAAEHGKHDDHVMSMVIALQILDEVRAIDPDIDDLLTPDLLLDADDVGEILEPSVA